MPQRPLHPWSLNPRRPMDRLGFILSIGLLLLTTPTAWAGGTPEAQTLEDLERVGTAIFAWATDQALSASAVTDRNLADKGAVTFDVTAVPVITAMDLEALLVPTYLSSLPTLDGWGNAYEYRLDQANPLVLPFTAIRSGGADGLFDGTVYSPGFTTSLDEDLVFYDGALIRRPMPTAAEAPAYTLQVIQQITAAFSSWRTDQIIQGLGQAEATPASPRLALVGCDGYSADISSVPAATAGALEALLVPNYLLFLPVVDGWGHSLEFRFDSDAFVSSDWFSARSPGSDDLFEGTVYNAGFTTADSEDIVAADGALIRRPTLPGAEQTETLGDMQQIGAAILTWVIDNILLPPTAPALPPETKGIGGATSVDVDTMASITPANLEALLTPNYLPCLPRRDFWGHDYEFWLDTVNLFASPLTGIRSRGSDDMAEGSVYESGSFPAVATDNDLLWVDGFHLRIPDATQLFLDGFESGDASAWSETFP